jgi:hypothetical protein
LDEVQSINQVSPHFFFSLWPVENQDAYRIKEKQIETRAYWQLHFFFSLWPVENQDAYKIKKTDRDKFILATAHKKRKPKERKTAHL